MTLIATEFGVALTIILIFLLTQDPHDCFECLGKDPNASKYSIYQYERNDNLQTGLQEESVFGSESRDGDPGARPESQSEALRRLAGSMLATDADLNAHGS